MGVEEMIEVTDKKLQIEERLFPHKIIEGDNIHALSYYSTGETKVDVIYIDPPYNTGATQWRYNNSYKGEEWIDMMRARLLLAMEVLKEEGFFVLAIDDYELFNIGCLCDKIFGKENRVAIITVCIKKGGRNQCKFVSKNNIYCLVYAKNIKKGKFNNVWLNEEERKTGEFYSEDEKGEYKLIAFLRDHFDGWKSKREKFWYSIYISKDLRKASLENVAGYHHLLPINKGGKEMSWKKLPESFLKDWDARKILAREEDGVIRLYQKYRRKEFIKNLWQGTKYNGGSHGTALVDKIIGKNKFNFAQSVYLVYDFLKLLCPNNGLVLDFFAGSGTTGHAVLMLNKQDGGDRQFILCQNNENRICEEVTYNRIKNVMEGYTTSKGKVVKGLGGQLEYFKVN